MRRTVRQESVIMIAGAMWLVTTLGHAQSSPTASVPRLEIRNGVMTWVNTRAFLPVPAALAKQGDTVCAVFDSPTRRHRAAGYHPRALNAQGKPFPGGGYFCVPK